MRHLRLPAIAGVALLTPFCAAQAATVMQTSNIDYQTLDLSIGPVTLNGFNSALGTLTGVQIEYFFAVDTNGWLENRSSGATSILARADTDARFSFAGPSSIAGDHVLNFTPGLKRYSSVAVGERALFGPFNVSGSGVLNPVDLAEFVDRDFTYRLGTFSSFMLRGGGGNLRQNISSHGQGHVRLVYDYSAAPGVPEPASWALMIAGFGLVGAAMRRRQARALLSAA